MTLTAKQLAAIAKAPASQKQQLRNTYHRQQLNNGKPQRSQPTRGNGGRFTRNAPANAARPKAAPTPARKQKPGATMGLKIPNYLDPICQYPVPTVLSDGKALPHTGMVREHFQHCDGSNWEYTLLICQNTGDSGSVAYLVHTDLSGVVLSGSILTIPTLKESSGSGGPSAARAMKLSVNVVNTTNAMHRAGRIVTLNSSQRLPGRPNDPAVGELSAVISGVRNSPYSRMTSAQQFTTPQQLISFPVDPVSYSQFHPFRGEILGNDFFDHIFSPPRDHLADQAVRPMSTIVYLFEPTTAVQDYSVTIRASYYTRWPLESVPGQSMQAIPTAPAQIINAVRDNAEAKAQDLKNLPEGSATQKDWAGSM